MSRQLSIEDIREIAIAVEQSMRGIALVRREERGRKQFVIHQPFYAQADQYIFFVFTEHKPKQAHVYGHVTVGFFFRDQGFWYRLWQAEIHRMDNIQKVIVENLREFLRNPIRYLLGYTWTRLQDYFVKKLSESTSKEDFLEKLGHVWYQAIRANQHQKIESCMRGIVRVGVPFGVDIAEIDALHERLVRAIKAGNAFI